MNCCTAPGTPSEIPLTTWSGHDKQNGYRRYRKVLPEGAAVGPAVADGTHARVRAAQALNMHMR